MLQVNQQRQEIYVDIPLTTQTGKTRVKVRNTFADYGEPTATRQTLFGPNHYIEWQIGYDVTQDRINDTTLGHLQFTGANGRGNITPTNSSTISKIGSSASYELYRKFFTYQ